MPQAVWVGDLSFGLVNIPIKLYAATSPKRVRFHQYEEGTGRRIHYRRVVAGTTSDEMEPSDEGSEREQAAPALGSRPDEQEATGSGVQSDAEDSVLETEVPWDAIVKGYEVEPGRV